jgi:hypothetical protein
MTEKTTPVEHIRRLTTEDYAELEKTIPGYGGPVVLQGTTELQAGFMLGVQAVLAKLREGYVVRSS